jgi:hypothetical protein
MNTVLINPSIDLASSRARDLVDHHGADKKNLPFLETVILVSGAFFLSFQGLLLVVFILQFPDV